MSEHYSDLQFDPNGRQPNYPIPVSPNDEGQRNYHAPSDKIAASYEQATLMSENPQPKHRGKICGLAPRTFWLVAAIFTIIIIAAAVGGGVGGSRASKASSSNGQSSSSTSATVPPLTTFTSAMSSTSDPATGTSTIPITTSTTIGPTATLLVDCPSSNDTVYVASQSSQMFRKACYRTFISNGFNVISQNTQSLDSCIDVCAAYNVANATQIASGAAGICNAVCWRATIQGDDAPGHCFGFLTTNSSGAFVYNDDARCNGAALINQAFT